MDILTSQEITQLVILGVILLGILFALRLVFRLTMSVLRLGCVAIFLIFIAALLLMVLR